MYVVGFPFYNCDVSELFQTKFFVKVVQFLVTLFCGDVGINERDLAMLKEPSGSEALDPMTGGLQIDGGGFELLKGFRDISGFDVLEVVAA